MPSLTRGLVMSLAVSMAFTVLMPGVVLLAAEPLDGDTDARVGIRVVDGDAEFFEVATGETWVPRGTNLLNTERGGPDGMVSARHWDPAWVEGRLAEIAARGYNAIRVFYEMCVEVHDCTGGPGERLSDEFLDNAAEYLRMAAAHGLHVMFSSNDLPPNSWYVHNAYDEGDSDFVSPRNVEIYREYYRDFIEGLVERDAPLDWLWSYEIRNEYTYQMDWPPWTLNEGLFTAANGQVYEMGDAVDRERLSADSLLYWADEMTTVIKAVAPDVLVSIGLLLPADNVETLGDPADPRWLIAGDFFEDSAVDFVDVHGMAGGTADGARRQWVLNGNAKPIVVGEFTADFASEDIVASMATDFVADSCQDGFDGWLTWHWEARKRTIIDDVLAPVNRPDPCVAVPVEVQQVSWRKPVKASQSEGRRYGPRFLVDNDPESYWSAAYGGPQWAEINLRETVDIGSVRLPIGIVTPTGPADIKILVRGPGTRGKLKQVHRFKRQKLQPGDVLEVEFEKPLRRIRAVRIRVDDMNDSWVILHDVEVWRAAKPTPEEASGPTTDWPLGG